MSKVAFSLTHPPRIRQQAKLDTIVLLPASLLPLKETYQHVANTFPPGTILCVQSADPRQEKVLEHVTAFFRAHQRHVVTLPMEQLPRKQQSSKRQAQTLRLA